MIVDGRSLSAGESLAADLAIVGAGAAGITLARALARSGLKIALIESGGLDYSEEAQDLAAGELGPQTYAPLNAARLRQLGGTTGHWDGWCRQLDAIDFEPRDFVPQSGWPITKADLDPYYDKAQPVLQLGTSRYADTEAVARQAQARLPIASGGDIEPVLFEFSPPTRMGEAYRADLETAEAVTTYLNSTVTDIRVSDDLKTVQSITLARDGAAPLSMTVRHLVIACGGMSNAQILLNADTQMTGGLGNANDQVGRYFTDHPILIGYAAVLALDESAGGSFATGKIALGERNYRLTFQPSDAARRAKKRLSCLITIEGPGPAFDPNAGTFSQWDDRWFGPEATAVALARMHAKGPVRVHMLNAGIETLPNPDSRITLIDGRDRFGSRRIKFDWHLQREDLDHYLANLADLGAAMAKSGSGIVRIAPDAHQRWPKETAWGHHHLGGTRMGDDPKTSVCDRDGRVHGMANLWIAGSSVFPTPGAANPTLNIVALALRLADKLQTEMPA